MGALCGRSRQERSQFVAPQLHILTSFRLLLFLCLLIPWQAASGQAGGDTLSYLTAITVLEDVEGKTVLKLQLAPRVNTHVAATDAAGTPAVAFTLTMRGQQLTVPSSFTGPVRAIRVEDNPGFLFLRFDTKRPGARISAIDNPDTSVSVTIIDPGITANDAKPTVDGITPVGINGANKAPSPASVDFSAMGFELVMLEYADVSEVAGLLADNVTIKPNDKFVPHSPGFGSTNANGMGSSYNPSPQTREDDKEPLGQSINANIGIDRRLNAIWLRGDSETIKRMKAQIAMIDQPIDTVMLETQIVELTETGARNSAWTWPMQTARSPRLPGATETFLRQAARSPLRAIS